jgi:hypothetical protein
MTNGSNPLHLSIKQYLSLNFFHLICGSNSWIIVSKVLWFPNQLELLSTNLILFPANIVLQHNWHIKSFFSMISFWVFHYLLINRYHFQNAINALSRSFGSSIYIILSVSGTVIMPTNFVTNYNRKLISSHWILSKIKKTFIFFTELSCVNIKSG